MQNKSVGLILYVKIIKDNDLFIKILSSNDNIISGLVYGGNSSKKRPTYQLGNLIEYNQFQKNPNIPSSINGDIVSPYIGGIYNDKFKLFSLLSIISILNKSVYEGVKINGLFISVRDLIDLINIKNHWIANYCEWLLYFLKLLGYEIDYRNNHMEYFNLNSLNFQLAGIDHRSIKFPYELFNKNYHIKYETVNSLFIIFETVFKKNILNDFHDEMPLNYINFKNLVLMKLKKYE